MNGHITLPHLGRPVLDGGLQRRKLKSESEQAGFI